MDSSIAILGGICGIIGAVAGFAGIILTRRSARDANATSNTIAEFQVLKGTVETLQTENHRLVERNEQLDAEILMQERNVSTLRRHAREHAPDVSLPDLEHWSHRA